MQCLTTKIGCVVDTRSAREILMIPHTIFLTLGYNATFKDVLYESQGE